VGSAFVETEVLNWALFWGAGTENLERQSRFELDASEPSASNRAMPYSSSSTHIFVCTSSLPPELGPSCGAASGAQILDRLPFLLAEQGLSGIRVTACGCLGACGEGANLVVWPEGVFYKGVTLDNLAQLVEQHFVVGEPLAELVVAS
jgi:(2Fe-2S) ferredoxin